MGIISWIIVGGIAGWLAGKMMNMDKSTGALANIIIGIIGGSIGGFIMDNFFGKSGAYGINPYSIFVSFLGSIILIAVVRLISRKS